MKMSIDSCKSSARTTLHNSSLIITAVLVFVYIRDPVGLMKQKPNINKHKLTRGNTKKEMTRILSLASVSLDR